MKRPEGKKSILVTGAAGFVAFHTIEKLLTNGVSVVGVDNFDSAYDRNLKDANIKDLKAIAVKAGTTFDFHTLDIVSLDAKFSEKVSFDSIIHLAARAGARASVGNWEPALRNNIQGTWKVLEFARTRGISNFVFASCASVYGADCLLPFKENAPSDQPQSPYAATKRSGELICHEFAYNYGMKVACLRFFSVYGPRQRPDQAVRVLCRAASEGQIATLFGDGSSTRDYIYITDAVDMIEAAVNFLHHAEKNTFEVFNVGTSRPMSLTQLITAIEAEIGTDLATKTDPALLSETQHECADLDKTKNILSVSPQITLAVGLARYLDWYRGQSQTYKQAA